MKKSFDLQVGNNSRRRSSMMELTACCCCLYGGRGGGVENRSLWVLSLNFWIPLIPIVACISWVWLKNREDPEAFSTEKCHFESTFFYTRQLHRANERKWPQKKKKKKKKKHWKEYRIEIACVIIHIGFVRLAAVWVRWKERVCGNREWFFCRR